MEDGLETQEVEAGRSRTRCCKSSGRYRRCSRAGGKRFVKWRTGRTWWLIGGGMIWHHSHADSKIWYKWTHLQKEGDSQTQRTDLWSRRREREFGLVRCKLLHMEWISNKVLLYSTGELYSISCDKSQWKRTFFKKGCIYTYSWTTLQYARN